MTVAPTAVAIESNPIATTKALTKKEFSACEVKTSRPYNSVLIYKNRKLSEGNKRYTADIYKIKERENKSPMVVSYVYNLKDKGKVVANFRFDYKESKKPYSTDNSNQSSTTQTSLPQPDNMNVVVWDTTFSGCGPRPKDNNYPVISVVFYDTIVGLKLKGYRSPLFFGQVTELEPFRVIGAVNQKDEPGYGN